MTDEELVAQNYRAALQSQSAQPETNPSVAEQNAQVAQNYQAALASQRTPADATPSPAAQNAQVAQNYQTALASQNGQNYLLGADRAGFGSPLFSTNDWHALPPQYQSPNYYAINGQIIDRRLRAAELAPPQILGIEGGGNIGPLRSAHGRNGYQQIKTAGFGGYGGFAGQLGPWAWLGGEVT